MIPVCAREDIWGTCPEWRSWWSWSGDSLNSPQKRRFVWNINSCLKESWEIVISTSGTREIVHRAEWAEHRSRPAASRWAIGRATEAWGRWIAWQRPCPIADDRCRPVAHLGGCRRAHGGSLLGHEWGDRSRAARRETPTVGLQRHLRASQSAAQCPSGIYHSSKEKRMAIILTVLASSSMTDETGSDLL